MCFGKGIVQAIGYGVMAGGASFVLPGIPMAITGAWKAPIQPKRSAAAIPAVRVGARAASLTWRF
jgi:hypothetical protein